MVTGVFCLGFQICAIIVPAWYRVRVPVTTSETRLEADYNVGFWLGVVCLDDGYKEVGVCVSKDMQQVSDGIVIGGTRSKQLFYYYDFKK